MTDEGSAFSLLAMTPSQFGRMRAVTAAQMRELDRRAIEEFGIPGFQLMENAGRAVAEETARLAGAPPKKILILAGKGNNGGDGLVAARYLREKGYEVQVLLFSEGQKLKADPARNFAENAKRGVPCRVVGKHFDWGTFGGQPPAGPSPQSSVSPLQDWDLIIDALFGVGLDQEIREPAVGFIHSVNASGRKVVAVDIPSGLHADTGEILGACVKATVTVTMGWAKQGFFRGEGPKVTGAIVVADIGIPKELLTSEPLTCDPPNIQAPRGMNLKSRKTPPDRKTPPEMR